MSKNNFIALVWGVVGGILFALGMCMCLLPEWGVFGAGVVLAVVGLAALIVLWLVRRTEAGKPAIRFNAKTLRTIALAIAGMLVLGLGMCMIMLWDIIVWGIVVGIVGIVLLLCLIPVSKGFK